MKHPQKSNFKFFTVGNGLCAVPYCTFQESLRNDTQVIPCIDILKQSPLFVFN